MSALSRFRKESPFEARDLARELEVKIIKLCMNEKYFPKRYRFTVAQSIIESVQKMGDYITIANRLPVYRDCIAEREKNQRYAFAMCEVLLRKLDLAERLGFSIPEGLLTELVRDIDKEEKSIKGWIASDKKRLNEE